MKYKKRVCVEIFRHTLFGCMRMRKMQGTEIEGEGSVLKYIPKSKIEKQHSSLHIMTHRLLRFQSSEKDLFLYYSNRA